MPPSRLESLCDDLQSVALARLGSVPAYGIFRPGREALANRVVTVVYHQDRPVAFSTVMYCPLLLNGSFNPLYQLGLVVSDSRSRSLLYPLYFIPLTYILAIRGFQSYRVGSLSTVPKVIGMFADNLADVYPHYSRPGRPPRGAVETASVLLRDFGSELAACSRSEFDPARFTISHGYEGASAVLRRSFADQPKYDVPECNAFCQRILDYERGDDLFQLGRVHLGLFLWTVLIRLARNL
uniref:Uncharacterized protein n=1 Tax=candidate division WOR-3 bacterium TaxID=2052148 RepID=A0A7C4GC39_UNCW3